MHDRWIQIILKEIKRFGQENVHVISMTQIHFTPITYCYKCKTFMTLNSYY